MFYKIRFDRKTQQWFSNILAYVIVLGETKNNGSKSHSLSGNYPIKNWESLHENEGVPYHECGATFLSLPFAANAHTLFEHKFLLMHLIVIKFKFNKV